MISNSHVPHLTHTHTRQIPRQVRHPFVTTWSLLENYYYYETHSSRTITIHCSQPFRSKVNHLSGVGMNLASLYLQHDCPLVSGSFHSPHILPSSWPQGSRDEGESVQRVCWGSSGHATKKQKLLFQQLLTILYLASLLQHNCVGNTRYKSKLDARYRPQASAIKS